MVKRKPRAAEPAHDAPAPPPQEPTPPPAPAGADDPHPDVQFSLRVPAWLNERLEATAPLLGLDRAALSRMILIEQLKHYERRAREAHAEGPLAPQGDGDHPGGLPRGARRPRGARAEGPLAPQSDGDHTTPGGFQGYVFS